MPADLREYLTPAINVLLVDEDTGRVLRKVHNAITTRHRQEYASFLVGQSVALPRYIAIGNRAPGLNVTPTEFTQILSETARSGIGQALLEGSASTTARIAATLGPGVGGHTIREAGLFSAAEDVALVHKCDVHLNWDSDGDGAIGITTTGHIEGIAALTGSRDAASEARSFFNSSLVVDVSDMSAAAAHLQFWYYVDDASLLGTGHSVTLTFGNAPAVNRARNNLTPSGGGAIVDGWNFFDIPLTLMAVTDTDLANNITGFELRVVKTNNEEIEERLDLIRLWQPSGVLWAYTPIAPALPKAPHQSIGIYWYLSIDIAGVATPTDAFAFEQITIPPNNSLWQLDASIYQPTGGTRASQALIQNVGSTAVKYRTDGMDPTVTLGHLLAGGDSILLRTYNEITRFRAIESVDGGSTLAITYRR